ncbi:cobyrinate a,c-diamide synthase [Solemya velesiana gill symbiont]|uniref:Cobyrinate a,c-diamide synthase n=1 Tax=Solemya velesiana gill symbiont TaxID=1918948 RepID=A0A1T2KXC6_9GAMM|nr:cobyrinate a,c-diamide synthase [Solemya velesiana gill symbiont]OOZ37464.1 cobyrinic acid a,c-diamide synthase [Solemya velesiana gill symbiont]
MSYFFISAAHKSSGKTTVSIGLGAALKARGMSVQPFKKGPDYIDPLWLTAATGRSCINLDFYTMPSHEIEDEFARHIVGADIGLIEGNKGLYDGLDLDGSNSNAALATLFDAPVILVIDARGMTRGIAPLILGYQAFDPDVRIQGVILNKVGGSRHEGKLRRVIEHYTDAKVVGAVHYAKDIEIDERHLGLIPSNEVEKAREQISQLGKAVGSQVDLDRVIEIAATSPNRPESTSQLSAFSGTRIRIGFPRDKAFGFYYPGDLEKLEAEGVELVEFNALADRELPDVDGLFIGGGFPEMVMQDLEANTAMRESIRRFIDDGGPVYAECGGLMYLSRSLTWEGKRCSMVGAIPGHTVMYEKPQGRGYVRLQERSQMPWPRPEGGVAPEIAAHEFHYSAIEYLGEGVQFAYDVKRGAGIDGQHDGLVYKNVLASYTHLRDVGGNCWTQRFVDHIKACMGS